MSMLSSLSSVTSLAAGFAAGLVPELITSSAKRAGLAPAVKQIGAAPRKPALGARKTATASTVAASKAGATRAASVARTVKATGGYATGSAGGDFAFLKDPTLSVEEKLFRFMCAIAKRNDDEVLKKMEEMKGGTAKAGSGSSAGASTQRKSGGTSIWSALKAVLPPLGLAAKVLGDAKIKSLLTQVSGPVLAAACTALGMPALAPLALQAGPELASALMNGKLPGEAAEEAGGSSAGGGSSGSGAASGSSSGKNEQVQMMELQRLVDKQKEMFAMISNVLRAQHDTRMTIIGNVR